MRSIDIIDTRNLLTEDDLNLLFESTEGSYYLLSDDGKPILLTAEYLINYYNVTRSGGDTATNDNERKLWSLEDLMLNKARFVDMQKNDRQIYANMLSPEDFEEFGGETMDEILFEKNADLYNKMAISRIPDHQQDLKQEIIDRKSNIQGIHSFYYNEKKDYDYAFKAMKSPYKALQKSFHSLSESTVKTQEDLDDLYKKAKNKSHKFKTFSHEGSNFLSSFADTLDDITPEYDALHVAKTKDGKTASKLKAFGYGALRFAAKAVLPISVSRKRSFFKGNGALASIGNFAVSTAASLVIPGILIGASFAFPPLAPAFLGAAAVYGIVFTIPALIKNIFNLAESLHLSRQRLKTTEMQKKGVDKSLEKNIEQNLAKNNKADSTIHSTHGFNTSEIYTPRRSPSMLTNPSDLGNIEAAAFEKGQNIATKLCRETNNYSRADLVEDASTTKYPHLSNNDKNIMDKIYTRFGGSDKIKEIVKIDGGLAPDCYVVRLKDSTQPPFVIMEKNCIPAGRPLEINVKSNAAGVNDIKFTITNKKAVAEEIAPTPPLPPR